MSACVIQVIDTTIMRGRGKDGTDPVRGVRQLYSFDGILLAENDPHDFGMYERRRLREALLAICNLDGRSDLMDAKKIAEAALTP